MNQFNLLEHIKNIVPDIRANILLLHTRLDLSHIQDLLKNLGFVDESSFTKDGNLIESKMRYRGELGNIVIVQDKD